jgi:hypothetical protein
VAEEAYEPALEFALLLPLGADPNNEWVPTEELPDPELPLPPNE